MQILEYIYWHVDIFLISKYMRWEGFGHPNLVFQGGADRFGVEVEKWSLELAKNVCVTNP